MASRDVETFMYDPIRYFDRSITKMHEIPRDELELLQREAMARRFADHRQSIEMVRKLADRLGIKEVREFDEVVPLFFAHTAFKSYPAALLDRKRFDLMTKWLDKQTSYDLSRVDTAGCDTIDEWIERLDEQTPLEAITSSGTTGTISIIPKDKAGANYNMELWKMFLFASDVDPEEESVERSAGRGKARSGSTETKPKPPTAQQIGNLERVIGELSEAGVELDGLLVHDAVFLRTPVRDMNGEQVTATLRVLGQVQRSGELALITPEGTAPPLDAILGPIQRDSGDFPPVDDEAPDAAAGAVSDYP